MVATTPNVSPNRSKNPNLKSRRAPSVTFSHLPHGDAPRSSEAKAAGSRRSLTLTKGVRLSHARGSPVSGELTAPPANPHGESEVLFLPILPHD